MRKRMLTFVALTLVATAVTAHAQGGGGGGRRGGMGGPGRMGGGPGGRCAGTADSLTDAQKTQVRTLSDAFAKAHAPQLDSLRTIMEASRAAREAGKTPEEVRAIMETAKPIADGLAPARKEFATTVVGLLTPSQIAAGCIPPAPGGPPPGGRRGGPPRPPALRD
ncbi:MAG TPA: Spy/CpxP family protein refolding chaperone [Gemmatimonadaceae bacterium]|nr:Spy/CpxP family protein refolding chaperone [Gemmatimonadaceae bacterium]